MSDEWTPRKQALLMYLETIMVDGLGKIDHRKINSEEKIWAEEWEDSGLIEFNWNVGRVRFSEVAWVLAHRFRKERSERLIAREVPEA